MAKISGLGDYVAIDDSGGTLRDISNDITSFTITQGQDLIDVTGIDKSARERLVGLGDCTVTITGVFNGAANKSNAVFSNLSGTRTVTYAVGGNTSSNPELSMEMLVASYNPNHGSGAELTWTANLSLQSGTVPTWGTVA